MLPALVAVGCVIAGAYGALHDQLSFTISPDYFYAFKFHQFEIPHALQNRLGAALVGWLATWWVGAIAAIPLAIVAARFPDLRSGRRHALIAFAIVAATAVAFGLGALLYGTLTFTNDNLPNFGYPAEVADRVAFARVGALHNYGYLGGLVGIFAGLAYLAIARWRLRGVRMALVRLA
jgi:hypothetical protein